MVFLMLFEMLFTTTLYAQKSKSDGFFNNPFNDPYNDYYNRDNLINLGGAIHEDPTVPVGNGLLVVTIAGISYLLIKKNREAKK